MAINAHSHHYMILHCISTDDMMLLVFREDEPREGGDVHNRLALSDQPSGREIAK